MPVVRRIRKFVDLARQGDGNILRDDLRKWLHSDTESLGYRRDYSVPAEEPPGPDWDMRVKPLDDRLADALFNVTGLDGRNRMFLDRRRAMWEAGFRGGYVVVDPDDKPVFLQFFIPSEQKALASHHWGGLFPPIRPDTMLVEGAWIPPEFRGRKVMALAMFRIAEAAKADSPASVRYAETYIEIGNRGAERGCLAAGFEVFSRRVETWRLGRHTFTFEDVAPEDAP